MVVAVWRTLFGPKYSLAMDCVVETESEVRVKYTVDCILKPPPGGRMHSASPFQCLIEVERREKPILFYENGKKVAEVLPFRRITGLFWYGDAAYRKINSNDDLFNVVTRYYGAASKNDSDKQTWLNEMRNWVDSQKIDFKKEMVLARFKGQCPTSGFTLHIQQISVKQGVLRADFYWKEASGAVKDVVTYPREIVVCERRDLPVVFYENGKKVAQGNAENKKAKSEKPVAKQVKDIELSVIWETRHKELVPANRPTRTLENTSPYNFPDIGNVYLRQRWNMIYTKNSPVTGQGYVYLIPNNRGSLGALEVETGTMVWEAPNLGLKPGICIPTEKGPVITAVIPRPMSNIPHASEIALLDLRKGDVVWNIKTDRLIDQMAVAAGNVFAVERITGIVHCIDLGSGKSHWKTPQLCDENKPEGARAYPQGIHATADSLFITMMRDPYRVDKEKLEKRRSARKAEMEAKKRAMEAGIKEAERILKYFRAQKSEVYKDDIEKYTRHLESLQKRLRIEVSPEKIRAYAEAENCPEYRPEIRLYNERTRRVICLDPKTGRECKGTVDMNLRQTESEYTLAMKKLRACRNSGNLSDWLKLGRELRENEKYSVSGIWNIEPYLAVIIGVSAWYEDKGSSTQEVLYLVNPQNANVLGKRKLTGWARCVVEGKVLILFDGLNILGLKVKQK
jgi:hypothetical protein